MAEYGKIGAETKTFVHDEADYDSEYMMKVLDQVLAGVLVLLGCIHNFVAAPMTFSSLSNQALWFVSAGLALWYAGFINLLRARSDNGGRLLAWLSLVTNATLLTFVASYATVRNNWTAPESLFLVGVVAALTTTSALSLTKSLKRA